MDRWTTLLTALGAAVGIVLTSWAKVIKARADERVAIAQASRSKALLRRLWDLVEARFAHEAPTLSEEIREDLLEADDA